MKITRGLLLSLLAPGVVCLLVAVQIAYGLRGFDTPRGGVAAVLEVPGLLVGWGSLLFLMPLLVWLVLDWWGVTFSGIALKCLGATAVAIAVGAMFGIVGGVEAGGHLGAGLADLLTATLGTGVSLALLALMALPGLVLTCIGFLQRSEGEKTARTAKRARPKPQKKPKPKEPAEARTAEPADTGDEAPRKRSVFKRKKKVSNLADLVRDSAKREREPGEPWYPEARYDDSGNELPMDFGEHRDVGGIRFADPEPEDEPEVVAEADTEAPATEAAEAPADDALPTIPELFAGDYDPEALEQELAEEAEAPSDDEAPVEHEPPVEVELPPGARMHVDSGGRATHFVPTQTDDEDRVVEGLGPVVGSAEPDEEALMPGVRWAEPESPTAEVDEEEEEELFDEEEEAIGEIMRQTPTPAEPEEDEDEVDDTPSVKDSVLQALDGEAHSKSSKRYLQKLEASGIFDFMDGEDEPEQTAKPARKASRKKAPAKKKAAKKKTARKKKAAAKKKAPARKKAAKKAAAKKKATKKKAAKNAPKARSERAKQAKPASKSKASTVKNAPRPRPDQAKQAKPATKPKAKPTPPSTAVKDDQATDAAKGPRDQWQTGSWRHGPHGIQASAPKPPAEGVSESTRKRVIRERRDPHYIRAAEVCLERGAASPVLLTRRLGIGYTEAKSLVERLVSSGVLGPMAPSGSRPTVMTPSQWREASR